MRLRCGHSIVLLIRKRLGKRGANSRGAPGNHTFNLRAITRASFALLPVR